MRVESSITNVWGGYGGRLPGMDERLERYERGLSPTNLIDSADRDIRPTNFVGQVSIPANGEWFT
jgi:hypothetical protein